MLTDKIDFKGKSIGEHQECLLIKELEFTGTGDELEKVLKMAIKYVKKQRKHTRGSIRYIRDNLPNDSG